MYSEMILHGSDSSSIIQSIIVALGEGSCEVIVDRRNKIDGFSQSQCCSRYLDGYWNSDWAIAWQHVFHWTEVGSLAAKDST